MRIGDLVQYVTGSQLYFSFPSQRWDKILSGTIGLIIEEGKSNIDNMYFVKAINKKEKSFNT